MKCSICDREVDDDVKICPKCGHSFDFVYKYNDDKFHEQFDYETLNEQYDKNKRQRINSFLEKKKKEYEGITDKRERKKFDIKNVHKMIFVASLLSQLFTLFHLIAYYNDVYFDFSDSFILSFIIGNGILLFVVSIIGFFAKKGLKYYILDFEMFYLSFFYFINVYIIFHEYVSSAVWLYIAGFIIGIVVVLRYLKKYKEDNGDLVVMGMVYVFMFILSIGAIATILRVILNLFNILFDFDMKTLFLITISLVFAFAMGMYFTSFINNILEYKRKKNNGEL